MQNNTKTFEEKSKSKEWGAWKFVSNMLDNPDENGIYPTSKCYEQIHDFVVEQIHLAEQSLVGRVREEIEKSKVLISCDNCNEQGINGDIGYYIKPNFIDKIYDKKE